MQIGSAGVHRDIRRQERNPPHLFDGTLTRPVEEAGVSADVMQNSRPRRAGWRGEGIEHTPVDAFVWRDVEIHLLAQLRRAHGQSAYARLDDEGVAVRS